jgi:hypothetical protein
VLQELNKESLLLLYVADELSAKDQAEVDRMLASDAGLRAELDQLEGTIQGFESAMAALDAVPLAAESAAIRNIGQTMRQRLADQLVQSTPTPTTVQPRMRYPWWLYPGVAAAVVLISFVSWWGTRPDGMLRITADHTPAIHSPQMPQVAGVTPPDEDVQLADALKKNFETSNLTQTEKSVASLDAAEDQIAELSRAQSDFRYTENGNE